MQTKTLILNSQQVTQKINRIAYQLYETFVYQETVIIVGIAGQGYQLAEKISAVLSAISNIDVKLEKLSFNKTNPTASTYQYSGDTQLLTSGNVVLIDDVLNSGNTLIYATKYLLNQPVKQLVTAVLVDRIHRKFPIKADFVGLSLSTTLQEHIEVTFLENGETSVYLQ